MFTVALVSTADQIDKLNDDSVIRVRLLQPSKQESAPIIDEGKGFKGVPPDVNSGDLSTPRSPTLETSSSPVCSPSIENEVKEEHNPLALAKHSSSVQAKQNLNLETSKPLNNASAKTNGPIAYHSPSGMTLVTLTPAEELRLKVLTVSRDIKVHDDHCKTDSTPAEPQETVLEYFSRIYGFPSNNFEDEDATIFDRLDITEQQFVGPFHTPGYLGVSKKQMIDGLNVTISAVETLNTFYMFDHTSSGQLMMLETRMNKWYGYYLWRKVSERMGFVFEIAPGGYYAVYLENLRIWARCFVDEVLPSCKNQFYDPSQKIRAVLFDYEGRLRTFERKQFLPLTRAFLSVPVQKTIGKIDSIQVDTFPWSTKDIQIIRQKLEGEQFRASVSNYDTSTEPFAVMTVRLAEIEETRAERKQWRKLASRCKISSCHTDANRTR